MGGIVSRVMGRPPSPPPAPPPPVAPKAAVAPRKPVAGKTPEGEEKRLRRRRKQGQAQNILTTPYGTVGGAPTTRKTLLGE